MTWLIRSELVVRGRVQHRVPVAVDRRPPRRHAVDQLAAVGERAARRRARTRPRAGRPCRASARTGARRARGRSPAGRSSGEANRQWRSAQALNTSSERSAVRGAEPGARVPAGGCLVGAVVAAGDVAEPGGRARLWPRVEHRLHQTERVAERLGSRQTRAAHSGATALVPPITVVVAVHPELVAGRPGRRRRPHPARRRPRCRCRRTRFGTPAVVCQLGSGKVSLTPPPVAPPLVPSFHTVSVLPRPSLACQAGATAGQHVRAGRREVDVLVAVVLGVLAAVVAGRGGHRDAERGRVGEHLVQPVRACAVHWSSDWPQLMLTTAGDGVACTAVAIGVHEALVGVRAEVDEQLGFRRERAEHLDVQQHLAVGAVGAWPATFCAPSTPTAVTFGVGDVAARRSTRPGRPGRNHRRVRSIAATLAGAVGVGGKSYTVASAGHVETSGRAAWPCVGRAAGLRPRVQPEHGHDDAVQRGGHVQLTRIWPGARSGRPSGWCRERE